MVAGVLMQDVKLGRYKVAYWFPGSDPVLFSQMFDGEVEARSFAQSAEKQGYLYTLMESQDVGNGSYSWKLLSGGLSPYFGTASMLYKLRWIFAMFGVFLLLKR